MGVTVETRGPDLLEGLLDRLEDLPQTVTIGIHEDAEPYPDGTSVVQVAAAQEFGTPSTPARPFIRGWFDSGGSRELLDVATEMLGKVADDNAQPADVGEAVGEAGADGIQDYIRSGIDPPLAPATLANPERDQRGIPLLDTEHLWDQIDYESEPG